MKKIALDIKQMKHLKELGVDLSNASMAYYNFYEDLKENECNELRLKDNKLNERIIIEAFTLQDILETLPPNIRKSERDNYSLMIDYDDLEIMYTMYDYGFVRYKIFYRVYGDSMINNAYGMLCWCAKNNLLNNKK